MLLLQVNKNADLDTPPNHVMFSMMHSVKVTKRSSSNVTDDFINNSQMTTYSQYPYYSYYPQHIIILIMIQEDL